MDFHVNENTLLSVAERDAINRMFQTAETYRDMQIFAGIEAVLELWTENANFLVNSNCFSEEVMELKRAQIRVALPKLTTENLRLNLVTPKTTTRKPLDADTYILVDDSPYNIANSPARINIVPLYPWNTTEKAAELMHGKCVRYVENGDLEALADIVREILRER